MFKKLAFLGLSILSCAGLSAAGNQDKKIVAWDIHDVLFTKPINHGWQCKPNPEMFKVVDKLNKDGVKQVIFSNISGASFCKLIRLYPEHFKYFDLRCSKANAEGIFTRKPHAKYINKFLKKNKMVSPHNIIFFDDKKKNIEGAWACGIDAYQVTNASQVEDILREKLIQAA